MRKKILIVTASGLLLAVFIIFAYSKILQNLADQGGTVFEDRCNNVNPALISYKNSYIKLVDMVKNPKNFTQAQFMDQINLYYSGVNAYIPLETKWVDKQEKIVNSWQYKLFLPKYMQDLGYLQLDMYKAYLHQALNIIKNKDGSSDVDRNAATKTQEASNKYFEAYDVAINMKDWRKLLWHNPPLNCPEENLVIPDTSIEKMFPSPTPEEIQTISPRS